MSTTLEKQDFKKLASAMLAEMEDSGSSSEFGYEPGGSYRLNFTELFYRVIENLKYIIIFAVVGAALGFCLAAFVITPLYTATSKLYLGEMAESTPHSVSEFQVAGYLSLDYQEVFSNRLVLQTVRDNLNLDISYAELGEMVSVNNSNESRLMYINVTAESPELARDLANEFAYVAQDFIANTLKEEEPYLFEEAWLPTASSTIGRTASTVLGFLIGLVITVAVVTICVVVDDRIRTADDIQKYAGLPTLGLMPNTDSIVPIPSSRSKSSATLKGRKNRV